MIPKEIKTLAMIVRITETEIFETFFDGAFTIAAVFAVVLCDGTGLTVSSVKAGSSSCVVVTAACGFSSQPGEPRCIPIMLYTRPGFPYLPSVQAFLWFI